MIDEILARLIGPPPTPLVCVCTHTRDDHRRTVMSVPLRGRGHYPAKGVLGNLVDLSNPGATYTRDECHCGCCSWLPDTG